MGKSITTTARNCLIAELTMQGMYPHQIEKHPAINIKRRQIATVLKDDIVKEILDQGLKYYALHFDDIQEEFIALCHHPDANIRSKAISEYHKVMGMNSPHAPVFIGKLMIDNRQQTLAPELLNVLQDYSQRHHQTTKLIENKSKYGSDTIDIDGEEVG